MDSQIIKSADTIAMFSRKLLNIRRNKPVRSSEMGVLILVQRSDQPVTPIMISRFFQIAKPSVTEMINSLTNKGYLLKYKSSTDKRSYAVSLSKKGVQLLDRCSSEYFLTLQVLKKRMGHGEFDLMITLLEKANTILGEGESE